ncbi:hypothetical protein HNY73_020453 [Argiope bruennichi]|uniref:Uncharacterized protein n=1 Tax=Argiope bruennichi TaxID=94029 RepID=A0A8T0EBE1_ARGBR|nr:hypothetical protein HNY73_020453 [Argiope bruennichi]
MALATGRRGGYRRAYSLTVRKALAVDQIHVSIITNGIDDNHVKNTDCCKMQPFEYELNDGFTSYHDAHMDDVRCKPNILNIIVCKNSNSAVDLSTTVFSLAPDVTS